MPLLCPNGFNTCTTTLEARERFRKNNTDVGTPEVRPTLQRTDMTHRMLLLGISPKRWTTESKWKRHQRVVPDSKGSLFRRIQSPTSCSTSRMISLAHLLVVPWTLIRSKVGLPWAVCGARGIIVFLLGHPSPLNCDRDLFLSFGPGSFNYQAFACYDLLDGGKQTLDEYGIWSGNQLVFVSSILICFILSWALCRYGLDAKELGGTHLNLTRSLIGDVYQYGALFSFKGTPQQVNIRVGISFVSVDQACQNAEEEVGDSSFEDIMAQSKALWNDRLSRIEIDVANTPANVTELLYSSLYRASLTPVRSRMSLQNISCLTVLFRTMLLARRKARLRAPALSTLIPSTAGMHITLSPIGSQSHDTHQLGHIPHLLPPYVTALPRDICPDCRFIRRRLAQERLDARVSC